jgi:hypothetical protein
MMPLGTGDLSQLALILTLELQRGYNSSFECITIWQFFAKKMTIFHLFISFF